MKAHNAATGAEVPELRMLEPELKLPEPELAAVTCSRARDQLACRLLLTGADDSVHLMQQGGEETGYITYYTNFYTAL